MSYLLFITLCPQACVSCSLTSIGWPRHTCEAYICETYICEAYMVKKHWSDSQKRLWEQSQTWDLGVWRKCRNHKQNVWDFLSCQFPSALTSLSSVLSPSLCLTCGWGFLLLLFPLSLSLTDSVRQLFTHSLTHWWGHTNIPISYCRYGFLINLYIVLAQTVPDSNKHDSNYNKILSRAEIIRG